MLVSCLVVLAGLAVFAVSGGGGRSPKIPKFVPAPPASISPHTLNYYDGEANAPFRNDRMWLLTAVPGTNVHVYLYDLKKRTILGELLNAHIPVLSTGDGSMILCGGPASPGSLLSMRFRKMLDSIFARVGWGPHAAPNSIETFWFLDLPTGTATLAGDSSQLPGWSSGWYSSPNSRYGFTVPTTPSNSLMFLCDFDKKSLSRISISGRPNGWWDDQHILCTTGTNHFFLLDVTTQQTSTLFTPEYVSNFLTAAGLTNDPAGLGSFSTWNGSSYDFYFGITKVIDGLGSPQSVLLKVDKSGPALMLLYRNFTFRWGGRLDKTATHYLYQGFRGESGMPGAGEMDPFTCRTF